MPSNRLSWLSGSFVATAIILNACAVPPAGLPVAEPPAELIATETMVGGQYRLLRQMACLSQVAYGQKTPACAAWEGPSVRITAYTVKVPDIWGRLYDGSYSLIIDDDHRTQVVAIRGTDNLDDWLTGARFAPVIDDVLNVRLHHGFQLYGRAVLKDLRENGRIRQLRKDYDTYITGHSLGGAAGLLLGLYFYTQYPDELQIKGLYTFGQPRAFDNSGATSWANFASRVYHVENCYDPIPLVPIGETILGSLLITHCRWEPRSTSINISGTKSCCWARANTGCPARTKSFAQRSPKS
jgi:hypothetical protein